MVADATLIVMQRRSAAVLLGLVVAAVAPSPNTFRAYCLSHPALDAEPAANVACRHGSACCRAFDSIGARLVGAGVRSVRREAAGGRWLDGGGVTAVTCGRRRQGGGVWAGK